MKRRLLTTALMTVLASGFAFAQNPSCPRPDCPYQGQCPRNGNGPAQCPHNGTGDCPNQCPRNGDGQRNRQGQRHQGSTNPQPRGIRGGQQNSIPENSK